MSNTDQTGDLEYKVMDIASYIILHHGTIRMAASAYCVGKSTVHYYMRVKLPDIDPVLYEKVNRIMNENWDMKNIRGGEATARLYEEKNKQNGAQ